MICIRKSRRRKEKWVTMILGMLIGVYVVNMNTQAAGINYVSLKLDNAWVAGEISQEGEIDYYCVTVSQAGWLTVDYQAFSMYDSFVEVYDYDLKNRYCSNRLEGARNDSPKSRTDVLALEPGSYMVGISGNRDSGTYRVRASFKAAGNNESMNNDSFETAQVLSLNQSVTGFISIDDRWDFYKINVSSGKTIRLTYTTYIESRSHMQVWDGNYISESDKRIDWSNEQNPVTYVYEKQLPAGIYYIKIYSDYSDNTGKYTLKYEEKTLISGITVTGNKNVAAGKSFQLGASVSPDNAMDQSLKWESADSSIASVSETGKVTTYRAGKVNITVSAQDGSNVTKIVPVIVLPKKMKAPSLSNVSKRKIRARWSYESGVSGYQLQYSKNKSFKSATTKKISGNMTSKNITKLTSKKKYYVRVRGYVKIGSKYYYGAWSSAKGIKVI